MLLIRHRRVVRMEAVVPPVTKPLQGGAGPSQNQLRRWVRGEAFGEARRLRLTDELGDGLGGLFAYAYRDGLCWTPSLVSSSLPADTSTRNHGLKEPCLRQQRDGGTGTGHLMMRATTGLQQGQYMRPFRPGTLSRRMDTFQCLAVVCIREAKDRQISPAGRVDVLRKKIPCNESQDAGDPKI
jgi:hypothetical protein